MNIIGTIKSYENGKDVFGYSGGRTVDHIWPLSKNGSGTKYNRQMLTSASNNEKSNDTKGHVNGVRFAVKMHQTLDNGKIEGQMYVTFDDEDWYEVMDE